MDLMGKSPLPGSPVAEPRLIKHQQSYNVTCRLPFIRGCLKIQNGLWIS